MSPRTTPKETKPRQAKSPADLLKAGKKGEIELSEAELTRVAGGTKLSPIKLNE